MIDSETLVAAFEVIGSRSAQQVNEHLGITDDDDFWTGILRVVMAQASWDPTTAALYAFQLGVAAGKAEAKDVL